MQRYNVFNQIHKGLRGMLYNTALQIQQTDFAAPEADATIQQLEQVLLFFDTHAEHEDGFILPHIKKHNPQLVDELEKDHDVDHRLTQTLFESIEAWKVATQPDQKELIGQRIFFAFNEFIAFNLYHMNKEENVLMYQLWKHYTDAEIHQMEGNIIQSIPPQTLFAESRWMMRSINDKEVTGWLSGMKQSAPAEVFTSFLQMAEDELSPERLARVKTALALA
ncbi:hemerythrin domain-containing protein [Spirosoma validum]|uniref:Hemerythrin domain-containing protein n=1 Tax=Spirosoma validum TaxID=2771355 RepID=A0A927B0N3_9BACT|nr:hemerythrin domain-containing protein [Spirosoma validum]MBD2753102.1 hemerythrin domain-containing protein [Spirosoma validum]